MRYIIDESLAEDGDEAEVVATTEETTGVKEKGVALTCRNMSGNEVTIWLSRDGAGKLARALCETAGTFLG